MSQVSTGLLARKMLCPRRENVRLPGTKRVPLIHWASASAPSAAGVPLVAVKTGVSNVVH